MRGGARQAASAAGGGRGRSVSGGQASTSRQTTCSHDRAEVGRVRATSSSRRISTCAAGLGTVRGESAAGRSLLRSFQQADDSLP